MTIPTRVPPGGKNSRRRGPPGSKLVSSPRRLTSVDQLRHRVAEQDPVVLVDVVLVGPAVGDVVQQGRVVARRTEAVDHQIGETGHERRAWQADVSAV